MSYYPAITINTKIEELPEFEICSFEYESSENPVKQFFEEMFPYIHQVITPYFSNYIFKGFRDAKFFEELSTNDIVRVYHHRECPRIWFEIKGLPRIWFAILIKNDPHEGNIPSIEFVDDHSHTFLYYDISLARKTPIYNYELCFDHWLHAENIPAEHVTEDVWKYCQYVLQEVRARLPEQQFLKPSIKNVKISISSAKRTVTLHDAAVPYQIEVSNIAGLPRHRNVRIHDSQLEKDIAEFLVDFS